MQLPTGGNIMRWRLCALAVTLAGCQTVTYVAGPKLASDVDSTSTSCDYYVAYKVNPAPGDYGPALRGTKETTTLCTYGLDAASFPVGPFTFKATANYPTGVSPESAPMQSQRPGPPAVPSGPLLVGGAPAPPSTINIGETAILPIDDNGNGNQMHAQGPYKISAATVGISLSFYVTIASGNLRLGVYDAKGSGGLPGNKVAETAGAVAVVGWNTLPLAGNPPLPAGDYWLAYLPDSNVLGFRKDPNTGPASGKYYAYTYGPMPTTFAPGMSSTASHWSLYLTVTK